MKDLVAAYRKTMTPKFDDNDFSILKNDLVQYQVNNFHCTFYNSEAQTIAPQQTKSTTDQKVQCLEKV